MAADMGYEVNIKRLRRLMRKVRWRTLYPTRCTTHADEKAYKYPYLLKGLTIDHPNHVWEIDISYIPMRHGFMYLLAIIDVFSRYVVGWSLSNTMTAEWCCSVLEEAFLYHGKPEIVNSDQGSQFTSVSYVELLKNNNVNISMDGRGRALDDGYVTSFRECMLRSVIVGITSAICASTMAFGSHDNWLHLNHSSKLDGVRFAQHFIERLWRSVKQEYVYLNPCTTGDELWHGLNGYFEFYNEKRPHQSLDYRTPAEVYRKREVTAA